jgi:CRP-like cAMP-binding protein
MNDRIFLINFIKQTNNTADKVADEIANHFEEIFIKRNEFILKQHKICNDYIFLENGFARAFTYDPAGNEVTTDFFAQRSIVFAVISFFKRTPSQENIQALSDCKGWKISFEKLNYLFHAMPEFRELGRMILVNGFVTLKERMLSMINQTAEQRYEQLLISKPEIFKHAPLKNIASYLGITDTSLSRIRKEFAK